MSMLRWTAIYVAVLVMMDMVLKIEGHSWYMIAGVVLGCISID